MRIHVKTIMIVCLVLIVPTTTNAQSCPDNNHPHIIDLNLPSGTKWACCNIGAQKPEDAGGYYAWGETEEKECYDWETYTLCDNGSYKQCHDIGNDIAGTKYDVAHVKWGNSWTMPTIEQMIELRFKCMWTWITQNGINGYKVTGSNSNSIFLPAAGHRSDLELRHSGTHGYYWTSSIYSSNHACAEDLYFHSESASIFEVGRGLGGRNVRPVVNK